VQKYLPVDTINVTCDTSKPLSVQPYGLDSVALAAVMLDMDSSFELDLNVVFDHPFDFSIDNLFQAVIYQKGVD